jgi:hypothetical protein
VNDLPVFPIPRSGETRITPESRDTFFLDCIGISTAERDAIVGFFISTQGRYGAFRFEFESMDLPECRFDSDTGPKMADSFGPHNLSVPIKILRRI